MAINYNPQPQSNPPDPQVPGNQSTGVSDSSIDTVAAPVSYSVDYNAGLAGTSSSEQLLTSPRPDSNPPDPQLYAQQAGPPVTAMDLAPQPTNYGTATQTFDDGSTIQTFDDGSTLATGTDGSVTSTNAPADSAGYPEQAGPPAPSSFDINNLTSFSSSAFSLVASVKNAQQQAAVSAQRAQQQNSDWRVRLQLAPGADYLYKASKPGILQPLVPTDGIIFPYTPKIDLSYKANYSPYELTHSNYKGYFYQNSSVGDIGLTAHFTAQSTADANYVLAVIHFFRSATKMFYGQDAQRGSPPPLVFLTGLGQYQFNNHPCLISEFTYSLPDDVDYIRAQTTNNANLNLTSANTVKQGVATNTIFNQVQRLAAAFTNKGALPATPFGSANVPNLAQGSPTYVPTKIDITIRLLPVNTRKQASQQFSVKEFAKGNLLRGGFW